MDSHLNTSEIYTLGYAPHTWESFCAVLAQYEITAVADVRSAPYSKFKPEFSYKNLAVALSRINIAYVFLGNLCGARPQNPQYYDNGTINFDKLAQSPEFQEGLSRIRQGAKKYRIVLLCAEKDPITCHRTLLIARHLHHDLGLKVHHILEDGTYEPHPQTETRLLELFDLETEELPGLGRSHTQRLTEAYHRQTQKITRPKPEKESLS